MRSYMFHMRCCAHILNLIVKDGSSEVARIRSLLTDLTSHYQLSINTTQGSSQSSASPSMFSVELVDDYTSFHSFVSSKRRKDSMTSELAEYLGEKLVPEGSADFDILDWWRVNGARLSHLDNSIEDEGSIYAPSTAR